MARDHLLLVTLLVLLLGVFLPTTHSDSTFVRKSQLFWVATDRVQCGIYSNGSNCDTLDGYLKREDVNFSLSDTTWIFLHGEHVVVSDDGSLDIVGARNVTLKGEDKCAMGAEECVFMMEYHGEGADIFVWESSHVTIEQLKLKDTYIRVIQTNNLIVNAVHFQNSVLSVKNPTDDYSITESTFEPSSYISADLHSCPYTVKGNCNFSFILKHCIKWSQKTMLASPGV